MRAKLKRRKATDRRKAFKMCAKQCKGSANYRHCMSACLKK